VMSIESLGLSRWVFEQIGESVLKNTDPRVKDVRQRMVYIIESPSRSGNAKMIEIFGKVEAQYRLGLRNPVEIMDLLISGGLEVELLDVCTAMLYFRLKDEKKRKLQERIDDIQLVEGI
ncbi:MAG: hypothetical protein ACE5DQ_00205, partial [Candidatus Paceibacterota bacterium]